MSENDDQRPKDNPFEAPSLTPGEAVASDVTTDTPGRTGRVLRHALVVMGLTFAGGFLVGFFSAVLGIPDDQSVPLLIGSNLLMMTSGFVWSAAANRNSRWTHLVAVALCVWPMGLVNVLFGVTVMEWFLGIIAILFTMVVGGLVSYLLAP